MTILLYVPSNQAIVTGNDVYYQEDPFSATIQLTNTGVDKTFFNGVPDWLYEGKEIHCFADEHVEAIQGQQELNYANKQKSELIFYSPFKLYNVHVSRMQGEHNAMEIMCSFIYLPYRYN